VCVFDSSHFPSSLFIFVSVLIAPELFARDGVNSKASDVYAFGIVCWEIVARSAPWKGKPLEMVMALVRESKK
jgi:serine/threonine protein kinase